MVHINHYLKQVTQVDGVATDFNQDKSKSLFIGKKAVTSQHNLLIFDSSDLMNLGDPYHPSNIFKDRPAGFRPFLYGGIGITTFVHLLNIAALGESLHNQKIVYLPFYGDFKPPGYLNNYNFAEFFSPLQAYQFALYSKISPPLKARIAKRLLSYNQVYWDPVLTALLFGLSGNQPINHTVFNLAKPCGESAFSFWQQVDYYNSYKLITKYNQNQPLNNQVHPRQIDWVSLMKQAEEDGRKGCDPNPFYMDRGHFAMIKSTLASYRNSETDYRFSGTYEDGDFQLFLDLCRDLRIKLLVIIEPFNGFWSDYTGISRASRDEYYQKIRNMVRKTGTKCLDYSDREYEPYFLHDAKHLGWKGWVSVDQELVKFYQQ